MNEPIINDINYDNLSASQAMQLMKESIGNLSKVLKLPFGIGWNYDVKVQEKHYLIVTIRYNINGVSYKQDMIGGAIPSAIDHFAELFEYFNSSEPTVFRETYTPTAYDMEQMADYFTKYPALYKQCFAKQISQSQPPFGMLTEEQRIRLCIIWKQYKQTINNE